MFNLGGPRPLGNSIEAMDLGFALQARCLEAVARGRASRDDVVVPVPGFIDAQVATAYLELYLGVDRASGDATRQ
jgi:adenosylhomocysteinase